MNFSLAIICFSEGHILTVFPALKKHKLSQCNKKIVKNCTEYILLSKIYCQATVLNISTLYKNTIALSVSPFLLWFKMMNNQLKYCSNKQCFKVRKYNYNHRGDFSVSVACYKPQKPTGLCEGMNTCVQ